MNKIEYSTWFVIDSYPPVPSGKALQGVEKANYRSTVMPQINGQK
jgi:hypothetical protein